MISQRTKTRVSMLVWFTLGGLLLLPGIYYGYITDDVGCGSTAMAAGDICERNFMGRDVTYTYAERQDYWRLTSAAFIGAGMAFLIYGTWCLIRLRRSNRGDERVSGPYGPVA